MIRTYYKDANGMFNHMGDSILTAEESLEYKDALIESVGKLK
jgi:hypothetical protein